MSGTDALPNGGVARTGRPVATAVALLLLFWWGATGLLIVLQRSAGTRLAALTLAILSGPVGLTLVARARARTDDRGEIASFFGGALLWTCVSAAFYGGWVVGRPLDVSDAAPTLMRALDAIAATAHSAVLAAALLAAAWRVTRGHPNRVGVFAFAIFWGAHELAKLNVFLGVVNPGTQFLPDYLAHLQRYFGPPSNSALLPVSVVGLTLGAAALLRASRRRTAAHGRTGLALLTGIVALAALEHALLGTTRALGWWDAFLAWRGV
jgi:putative photosynthetic complex assembly protein 2